MPNLHESADIFDEAKPWQWRVIRASLGTTTGAIVMAMLAKQPKQGPAFGTTCEIWPDGRVATKVRRHGKWTPHREPIGTTISVRDNIRRLADHCKLSDKDRLELFGELQKWIFKDHRARSET